MKSSLQMPVRHEPIEQVGPKTFRKQILRKGEIEYKGRRLRFDDPYLKALVESFEAGAYDQVPVVLADEDNRHNEDPEKFRGEVKALAITDDGLDAVIEMTAKGAELVRDNPRLGVSPRLVEDLVQSHGRFPHAIRHVCATLDPVGTRMSGWETVSKESVLSATYREEQVIDLTTASYMSDSVTLTDEHLEALKGLEGDARVAKARELLGESAPAEKPEDKAGEKPSWFERLFKGKSDDEAKAAFQELLNGSEKPDAEKVGDKETANLSAEAKEAIDLANSDAATAKADALKARTEVAEANWKLERKEYTDAGVPPAMLDLCEPIFKDGRSSVIDLSNGEKFDAAETIHKLLDEAKGYVDLSGERGSAQGEDDDERTEAKDLASDEKWEASV